MTPATRSRSRGAARARATRVTRASGLLLVTVGALGAPARLPVIGGREALATVAGDPVTMEEFDSQLAAMHQGLEAPAAKVARQRPWDLLERLINTRLILQEARNMGLDALPEVKEIVGNNRRDAMRSMLYKRRVQAITTAEPGQTEALYKQAVKEVHVMSILIDKESDARELESRVKAGGDIESLARELVSSGKARPDESDRYLRARDLLPEVQEPLSTMRIGQVSPLVRIGRGFAMMKLLDIRYPEDRAAREQAEKDALQAKRTEVLKQYVEDLKRRYTKVDEKVLNGVDFEAKEPGLERLLQDKRAVAEVKGEAAVTVGELTDALRRRFFHGADRAVTEKKINSRKAEVLDDLLSKRAAGKEAKRLKLDATDEYKRNVKDFEDGVLFGTFVQRAIDPTIKVDDADLRKHLDEHETEYTSPELMRLDALAFVERRGAEEALAKLQKGADFVWMRANAEGQVDQQAQKDLLPFAGGLVATSTFPAGLRRAVAGVRSGEFRFYGEGKGPWYVLHAREVVPPAPQPIAEVRDDIAKKVFELKRQDAVKDWAQKLRKAYEVKMFVTQEELDRFLGMGASGRRTAGAAAAGPAQAPSSRPTATHP